MTEPPIDLLADAERPYEPDDDWASVDQWEAEREAQRANYRRVMRNVDHAIADGPRSDWNPVPLAGLLDGSQPDESPEWLRRSDGRALLYGGKLHAIYGEPETGKGWLLLAAAAQIFAEYANGRVVYIDFEDSARSVVSRLLALGVPADTIRTRFTYVRPDGPLEGVDQLDDLMVGHGDDVFLVVLDGVTEGMVLHGLDPLSNADVAKWRERVVRPLVDPNGWAPVVEIDHVVKSKEDRGRFALGGITKLSGVHVAYSVKVLTPFGRGHDGVLQITVQKDRPGFVRGFATDKIAAIAHLRSSADGPVAITLEPPGDDDRDEFRPTTLMQRVSEVVIAEPGLTTNAIERGVQGKAVWVRQATRILLAEGYIERRREGNAYCHHSLRPYLEATDETVTASRVPPRPDRVPDAPVESPRPASPTLLRDADAGRTNGAPHTNGTASRQNGHHPDPDAERAERFARDYPEAAARAPQREATA